MTRMHTHAVNGRYYTRAVAIEADKLNDRQQAAARYALHGSDTARDVIRSIDARREAEANMFLLMMVAVGIAGLVAIWWAL